MLQDNQSTMRNMHTGKNDKLRHMSRTHRVNVHWIAETCRTEPIDVGACESHLMAGDMFTKSFTNGLKWNQVMKLISNFQWSEFLEMFNKGTHTPFPTTNEMKKIEIKMTERTRTIR